jgi:hypothetical protein
MAQLDYTFTRERASDGTTCLEGYLNAYPEHKARADDVEELEWLLYKVYMRLKRKEYGVMDEAVSEQHTGTLEVPDVVDVADTEIANESVVVLDMPFDGGTMTWRTT